MHVDAGNPLMHRFHNRPPSAKLRVREASSGLGRMPAPLARQGPIYRACCKLRLRDNLGYGLTRWVRLAVGVWPPNQERPLTRSLPHRHSTRNLAASPLESRQSLESPERYWFTVGVVIWRQGAPFENAKQPGAPIFGRLSQDAKAITPTL